VMSMVLHRLDRATTGKAATRPTLKTTELAFLSRFVAGAVAKQVGGANAGKSEVDDGQRRRRRPGAG
jgi:hypothetical protein